MNWISKGSGAPRSNILSKEIWQYLALDFRHCYGSGIVVSVPDPALPIVADPDSIFKTVFRIRKFCYCMHPDLDPIYFSIALGHKMYLKYFFDKIRASAGLLTLTMRVSKLSSSPFEFAAKLLGGLPSFLLVLRMNSWFLLVNCSAKLLSNLVKACCLGQA